MCQTVFVFATHVHVVCITYVYNCSMVHVAWKGGDDECSIIIDTWLHVQCIAFISCSVHVHVVYFIIFL